MDIISSIIYETSFRGTVVSEVERCVKGTAKCWIDKYNDRIVVSVIDHHNRVLSYEEFNFSKKLKNGISSYQIAHNAVIAYEKKIFREFFK